MTPLRRETRVTTVGGALGPMGIPEVKSARDAIKKTVKDFPEAYSEVELDNLTQLHDYLTNVIEEHTTVGRRF